MVRQYPGLAQMFRVATAGTAELAQPEVQDVEPTAQDPSPEAEEVLSEAGDATAQSEEPEQLEPETRRGTSAPMAAAAMMMRDYEMRLRSLEVQCRELSSQNARLNTEISAHELKQKQGRELNLRLSREVRELRRERSEATARVEALEQELARRTEPLSSAA